MGSNQHPAINQPERDGMIYVARASGYTRRLVETEARRSSQPIKTAARAVARRLRISHGAIWNLLFRPPKQISANLLFALETAVDSELERELGELENELARHRAGALKARRLDPSTRAEIEADVARLRALLEGALA